GKGLDLVLETAEIIKEKNLNIHWYIIGDGKLYDWFMNEITKRGLKDIVICKCFVFNTGSIVKDMDFLVHPSRFEGKSNTIDEALYYNVPVVATNFETVYEQIKDGYNGYITEMTGESIFEKIEQLYVDTVDYNRIKNNISNEKKTPVKKSEEFLNLIQSFKGDN
ncbi:glycosyltransferase, partial [Staphylococcus simulans]